MKFILLIGLFYFGLILIKANRYSCESGWENNEEKCYKMVYPTFPGVASEHKKLCDPFGAYPLHVTSENDNDWVTAFALTHLQTFGKNSLVWTPWAITGGFKPIDKEWIWETSSSKCPLDYANWGAESENVTNQKNTSLFIYLDYTNKQANRNSLSDGDLIIGKWSGFPENFESTYPVICQKAANGASPAAALCDYVKEELEHSLRRTIRSDVSDGSLKNVSDCISIKKTTLMAILESCSCT